MSETPEMIALHGWDLDEVAVADLERVVAEDPDDVRSRLMLLGTCKGYDPATSRKKLALVLWFMAHDRDNPILRSPLARLLEFEDGYAEFCEAWDRIADDPACPEHLLFAAAKACTVMRPERSRTLLLLGRSKWPERSVWSRELGSALMGTIKVENERQFLSPTTSRSFSREQRVTMAEEALSYFEDVLAIEGNDDFSALERRASAAFQADRFDLAWEYAADALALAPTQTNNRHQRDIVHILLTVRGLVCLQRDDVDGAIRDVLEAGEQGLGQAPVLRSFGPDFTLARALLARGERDAVVSYLKLCAQFWQRPHVEGWIATIEAGQAAPVLSSHPAFVGHDDDDDSADV